MLVVVSLSVIVTMAIAANYYRDIPNTKAQAIVPTATPTETPLPPQPTPTATLAPSATPAPVDEKCTRSAVYWAYHPESWPYQVVVGNFTYTRDQAVVLFSSQSRDIPWVLFIQFHAAILNYLSGTNPGAIEQVLLDASTWIGTHPFGGSVSEEDLLAAQPLAKALEDYNNGVTGPALCQDDPSLLGMTIEGAPIPTLAGASPTVMTAPGETQTLEPTATAAVFFTNTPRPPGPYPTATNTQHPTKRPPRRTSTSPPPTNTQPPPPEPTNTPKPPTPTSPP